MIRFSLLCDGEHPFEAWFSNSAAFERQNSEGLVRCPVCGSAEVQKSLMTPAVSTSRKREAIDQPQTGEEPNAVSALRTMREKLIENAQYVGGRFAEEARRIHFDEVEKRGIYGEATLDEVRSLAEDGVEFHPLPLLPEDHN